VYTDGRRELPRERLLRGLKGSSTPGVIPRAVIVEPHPALRAVLEYLLAQEGYAVEAGGEAPFAEPGLALLLVASEDGGGLYIFEAEKAAETLEKFSLNVRSSEVLSGVTGILAFVPKPFGARDVLHIVRAVSGFDVRKKMRSWTA
jgi:DNA-binding response OmpR family regulator